MNLRGAVIGAAAVALVAGCSSGEAAEPAYTPPTDGAVAAGQQRVDDAYEFCIDAITDKLKAPATAEFSDRDPTNEARDGHRYLFTGTVDSENGFGALVRSDWACEIRWDGGEFVAESATVETR